MSRTKTQLTNRHMVVAEGDTKFTVIYLPTGAVVGVATTMFGALQLAEESSAWRAIRAQDEENEPCWR